MKNIYSCKVSEVIAGGGLNIFPRKNFLLIVDTDQPIDINIGEKAILAVMEIDDHSLHVGTINYNTSYFFIMEDPIEILAENEAIS